MPGPSGICTRVTTSNVRRDHVSDSEDESLPEISIESDPYVTYLMEKSAQDAASNAKRSQEPNSEEESSSKKCKNSDPSEANLIEESTQVATSSGEVSHEPISSKREKMKCHPSKSYLIKSSKRALANSGESNRAIEPTVEPAIEPAVEPTVKLTEMQ